MTHVTLKSTNPGMKHVTLEGQFEYEANEDGLIQVHPAHVAAARSLGFKHPSEFPASAPIVLGDDPKKPEETKVEAKVEKDEFDGMNLAQLVDWLKSNGVPEDLAGAFKSKKDAREAARALKAEKAKAEEDPLA